MLWIFGLGFGAMVLFFLIRRLLGELTSLEDYRHKLEQAEARMQRELEIDLRRMPVSETLAPVASGLREIIELHGTAVPCEVVSLTDPPRIEARLPTGSLVITYRMKPAGRERTGCYWEVKTPDGQSHVCRNLDALMRLVEKKLEGEGCIAPILM